MDTRTSTVEENTLTVAMYPNDTSTLQTKLAPKDAKVGIVEPIEGNQV